MALCHYDLPPFFVQGYARLTLLFLRL